MLEITDYRPRRVLYWYRLIFGHFGLVVKFNMTELENTASSREDDIRIGMLYFSEDRWVKAMTTSGLSATLSVLMQELVGIVQPWVVRYNMPLATRIRIR